MHPAKPGDKTYEELSDALTAHSRRQGESVAKYVSELRSLAEFWNFGITLETVLRDRIICGINHDKIQNHCCLKPP